MVYVVRLLTVDLIGLPAKDLGTCGIAERDESIRIERADIDTLKHTGSRLRIGSVFTRRDLLHLALMSSENRAASALGRNYPGGLDAFVARMNARVWSATSSMQ